MKTLQTLLTATLFASISMTAQAGNPISSLTYEDSSNMFSSVSYQSSESVGILSYGDNANSDSVWSTEYEEYVNPGDFKQAEIASVDEFNQYMDSHPTAAGRIKGREIFIYNETAGEYHLQ